MRVHPLRAANVSARKAEVERQKRVVEAIWTRDKDACVRCHRPVMPQALSPRVVGHVKFHGPISIENGRLLCGLHFYGMILSRPHV
jgi:hypothetical protein